MLGAAKRVVELAGGGRLMAILVDADTRLVVQGITGREGSFHAGRNRDYGTAVVAGVTPGKGGQTVDGVPVFDTVAQAVRQQAPTRRWCSCRRGSPPTPSTRLRTRAWRRWCASPRASLPTTCFASTTTCGRAG